MPTITQQGLTPEQFAAVQAAQKTVNQSGQVPLTSTQGVAPGVVPASTDPVPVMSPSDVASQVATTEAMLKQTAAEGDKPFTGSTYDPVANASKAAVGNPTPQFLGTPAGFSKPVYSKPTQYDWSGAPDGGIVSVGGSRYILQGNYLQEVPAGLAGASAYVVPLIGGETTNPQSETTEINENLNNEQEADFSVMSSTLGDSVEESDSAKLLKALVDTVADPSSKPVTHSLQEEFAKQRAALGVGELETGLSNIDADIAKLDAEWSALQETEDNRLVSKLAINRRKSQEQMQYEKARTEMTLERNSVVNRLNQKYAVIESMVKYAGLDYDNAVVAYNTKFNQTVSLINLMSSVEESKKTDQERKTDNARANLQIVMEAVKGKDYDTLDSGTKTEIRNLELQSGLPSGFVKFVANTTDEPVVSMGSEFTDANGMRSLPVYTKDSNGVITAKIITLGQTSGGTGSTTKPLTSGKLTYTAEDIGEGQQLLEQSRTAGGEADGKWADPNVYLQMYQKWVGAGGLLQDFLTKYPPKNYVNPVNTWLPDFLMPSGARKTTTTSTTTTNPY